MDASSQPFLRLAPVLLPDQVAIQSFQKGHDSDDRASVVPDVGADRILLKCKIPDAQLGQFTKERDGGMGRISDAVLSE